MTVAWLVTGRSLPELGRMFGGRDHTTILYASQKYEDAVLVEMERVGVRRWQSAAATRAVRREEPLPEPWSDEDKAELLRLVAVGVKRAECAQMLGRSKGAVEKMVKRLKQLAMAEQSTQQQGVTS
jgi:hypothetical protein